MNNMGEAKRRKQLDPNYGKKQEVFLFLDNDLSSDEDKYYSYQSKIGKITVQNIIKNGKYVDKMARKLNNMNRLNIPSGCNCMPVVVLNEITVLFFTKTNFSQCVTLSNKEDMVNYEQSVLSFLKSKEIVTLCRSIAWFLIGMNCIVDEDNA